MLLPSLLLLLLLPLLLLRQLLKLLLVPWDVPACGLESHPGIGRIWCCELWVTAELQL